MVRDWRPPAREPGSVLADAPLDDGDVNPRQRELARQHQPRWASSGDHHFMLRHGHTACGFVAHLDPPAPVVSRLWPGTVRHERGLAASPRFWHTLEVERSGVRSPLPVLCAPPRKRRARKMRRCQGPPHQGGPARERRRAFRRPREGLSESRDVVTPRPARASAISPVRAACRRGAPPRTTPGVRWSG